MTILRWSLAILAFGLWAAAAWSNAAIVLKTYAEDERRPSMVMFMGALFAALALRAMPFDPGRWKVLGAWLALALLDAGSLGFVLLFLWAALSGALARKETR